MDWDIYSVKLTLHLRYFVERLLTELLGQASGLFLKDAAVNKSCFHIQYITQ